MFWTGKYATGMSYSYYFFKEEPLTEIFQQRLGLHVTIDNDSRAMAYGEFMKGDVKSEKNVLFVNVSWGLGLVLLWTANFIMENRASLVNLDTLVLLIMKCFVTVARKAVLKLKLQDRIFIENL